MDKTPETSKMSKKSKKFLKSVHPKNKKKLEKMFERLNECDNDTFLLLSTILILETDSQILREIAADIKKIYSRLERYIDEE